MSRVLPRATSCGGHRHRPECSVTPWLTGLQPRADRGPTSPLTPGPAGLSSAERNRRASRVRPESWSSRGPGSTAGASASLPTSPGGRPRGNGLPTQTEAGLIDGRGEEQWCVSAWSGSRGPCACTQESRTGSGEQGSCPCTPALSRLQPPGGSAGAAGGGRPVGGFVIGNR